MSSSQSGRVKLRGSARAQAETTATKGVGAQSSSNGKKKIYIGFEKGDYAPRDGRQGRFVTDDPNKYPEKNEYVGGWAGGEVGLKQFVQDYEKSLASPPPSSKLPVKEKPVKPIGKGSDTIYIGHEKTDFEGKRQGVQGRVIKDDARKYPERTELTGGFAGGELGLKKFVELGDVPIAEPGSSGVRQGQSPLIIAGLLGGAATVGGLILMDAAETGEQVLNSVPALDAVKATTGGLDENTKTLLQAFVLLAGLTGVVAGGRVIVSAAANSIKEGAVKLGTLAVFWVTVFFVAQYVLSS